MFRSVLKTSLAAVAFAALASATNAAVVSFQLQQSGFPTQTFSSGTSAADLSNVAFGTFFISNINAASVGIVSISGMYDVLSSSINNASTSAGGTLAVLITATDVSPILPPDQSFFSLASPCTPFPCADLAFVQEATFVDPADVAFSRAHLLGSATFSMVGQSTQTTPFGPLTAPYSLTAAYVITTGPNTAWSP